MACDGDGIPLHLVAARANDHDSPLLEPTLAGIPDLIGPLPDQPCMHLDRGYDSGKTRDLIEILGYDAESRSRARPPRSKPRSAGPWSAPISWMNGYGKLRGFTDKRKIIVEFYLYLTAALTVIRRLTTEPAASTAGRPDPLHAASANDQLPVAPRRMNNPAPIVRLIWADFQDLPLRVGMGPQVDSGADRSRADPCGHTLDGRGQGRQGRRK